MGGEALDRRSGFIYDSALMNPLFLHRNRRFLCSLALGAATGGPLCAGAQTAAPVPGVIVHHVPSPSLLRRLSGRAVYTSSPSIAVLPSGDYALSCCIFGAGSNDSRSGTTYLYGSSDRGVSWRLLTVLTGMKRGSLFVHRGTLFLWGYTASPGSIVIRQSLDGGRTWTEPHDERTGLLRSGKYGGTPCHPAVHDGRLWIAQGGRRVISAPADADLLDAAVWTLSRKARTETGPLGPGLIITEAQLVAAPHTGVVLLPKVQHKNPHTVLLRAGPDPKRVADPQQGDWVPFPGAEKKFAALYDAQSETFYALSNPVLPACADGPVPFQLVRNTGALLSSKDLRQWTTERIFLHTEDVRYCGFQYFACAVDGDDLIVASRTAWPLNGRRPPRQHDSNLITFHRITDFRRPHSGTGP